MTDIKEYIDLPEGEECPRCGEPIYRDAGFVYGSEYWHIDCYEKEHGGLPEVPIQDKRVTE